MLALTKRPRLYMYGFYLSLIYLHLLFSDVTTLYVSSYKGRHFRLSTQLFDHSLYSEEFQFTLERPQGNSKETPYFIYSGVYTKPNVIAPAMDLSYSRNFPLDVVVVSSAGSNSRRINLVDRSPNGHMISLGDHRDDECCSRKIVFSFYAVNITKPGNRTTTIKVRRNLL